MESWQRAVTVRWHGKEHTKIVGFHWISGDRSFLELSEQLMDAYVPYGDEFVQFPESDPRYHEVRKANGCGGPSAVFWSEGGKNWVTVAWNARDHIPASADGPVSRPFDIEEQGSPVRDTSRYSEREIVYVLERLTAEGRFFKIGKTSRNDVSRRAYEVRSTIVSYTNSVRERDVHRELRHSRVERRDLPAEITNGHGPTEWFRPTPEVERFAFEGILPSGRQATMVADRAA